MFPEELATGVCSLNPHVDRLVQSCLMEVTAKGDVVRHEMHDGIIRSDARMTYTAVNAILTDRDPDVLARVSRRWCRLFELMRELFDDPERGAGSAGARSTSTCPKPQVVLDDRGLHRRHRRRRSATSRTG